MAELLSDQQYVGEYDADTGDLVLTGTTPGPAGSYELRLDMISVVLDAADPTVVNLITVTQADRALGGSNRRLLERLIGAEASDAAVVLLGTKDRLRLGPPTTGPRLGPQLQQVEMARVVAMAKVVVGMSIADDAGLLPFERALGRLEAFHLMSLLDLRADVDDWPDLVHVAAVDLLDLTPDRIDPILRPLVMVVFEHASAVLDDQLLAARLRRAAATFGPFEPEAFIVAESRMDFDTMARGAGAASPAVAASAVAASTPMVVPAQHPVEVAIHSLPNLVAGKLPSINRTSGDEYEVRLSDWAERANGWWARAFRGADAVPLAAVPLTADGDDAVARFLVARSDAASLVFDIVDRPGESRPSASVASLRAAIASGKRAAQLERLERGSQAAQQWRRSSELHTAAGDEWRAASALARADPSRRRRRGDEVLVNAVINDWVGPVADATQP